MLLQDIRLEELQPHAWGYNIVDKTIEPNDESDPDRISKDTPIVYVPLTSDVTKSTKQTVVLKVQEKRRQLLILKMIMFSQVRKI